MRELAIRFFGRFRVNLIVGPLCKLVEVCFDILTPVVIARMIDEGVMHRDLACVVRYGVLLGVFALIGISFSLVCQKMASRASQGIGTDIRRELYRHINRLGYAELDRFGTPSLITRLTNDVNQVQLAVALAIRQLIRWPFLAIGSVIAAFAIDARLGIVFLVSTPIIALVFWFVMARCVPLFRELQARLDQIALLTREGLSGARVIRAFSRESHERKRFRVAADAQAAVAITAGKLSAVLNPVTLFVMNLAVCCILWLGGGYVNEGSLTQGEVMAFVNYMTQTLLSIVYVANLVVVFTKASASASRINEVFACEPGMDDAGNAPVEMDGLLALSAMPAGRVEDGSESRAGRAEGLSAPAAGTPLVSRAGESVDDPAAYREARPVAVPALRMRDVSFAYNGASACALQGVSLSVLPGETLGIIGGTGSGKSTLVSLIPRLYDVTSGAVEVLGRDVRAWRLSELRRAIGYVPQQATLISGTVRSNLSWRKEGASDQELWEALELAQVAGVVRSLPQGLDAPVEAGGKNFSGGQRQRLTIARALVGNPLMLVLDDSSSALDFKTEAALRRAIRARSSASAREVLPEGGDTSHVPCTTVIVSQRVSAVRDADHVCVLRHGRVAGLGTHEELLRTCEVYQEICRSQERRQERREEVGA